MLKYGINVSVLHEKKNVVLAKNKWYIIILNGFVSKTVLFLNRRTEVPNTFSLTLW